MGSVSPLGANLESDRLPKAALRGIWKVAEPLLKETPSLFGRTFHLAETFALTELSINEKLTDRSSLPRFQGKWLSLLSEGKGRPLYVLSRPIGPTSVDWLLLELHESHLGDEILDCLEFAKKHVTGRNLVRILRIPEHRLAALLLSNRQGYRVIIASAPFRKERFKMHKNYSYSQFLSLMSKTIPVRALQVEAAQPVHHSPAPPPELNTP